MTKRKAVPKAKKKTPRSRKGLAQSEFGRLVGCTQQRVSQLAKSGVIPVLPSGRIDEFAATPAYVTFIKRTPDEAMKRVREARAKEIELRVAKERRELISLEDVNYAVGMIASKFCGELAGVAAASTRDLGLREIIQTNLSAAILRFKASLDAVTDDAKAGRPIGDDDAEDEDED